MFNSVKRNAWLEFFYQIIEHFQIFYFCKRIVFYLHLENSMNFPVQIRLNIEVGENPAMRYI